MTTGEKILALRKARGWSQEEMAEHTGVSRQAVSRWESGTAMPDAEKLIAICECFGVSADYLLGTGFSGNASKEAIASAPERGLHPRQIVGLILMLFGLLCRFALEMLGVLRPHTHYSNTGVYHGLQAYVQLYGLQWMLIILWIMIGTGVLLMAWDFLKKFLQEPDGNG